MSTDNSIKIPDYLAQKFQDLETEDGQDLNSTGPQSTGHLTELISFGTWITETADGLAKQKGFPGTGQVPPDKLGELLGRIADKHLPEYMKDKTDEATGISLVMGIIAVNYMHYKKMEVAAEDENIKRSAEDE